MIDLGQHADALINQRRHCLTGILKDGAARQQNGYHCGHFTTVSTPFIMTSVLPYK